MPDMLVFNRIRLDISQDLYPADVSNYFRQYTPELLRSFESSTHDLYSGIRVEGIRMNRTGSLYIHSSTRPAMERTYFLFDRPFTQREWFSILGFNGEEQLMHCLVWGRND